MQCSSVQPQTSCKPFRTKILHSSFVPRSLFSHHHLLSTLRLTPSLFSRILGISLTFVIVSFFLVQDGTVPLCTIFAWGMVDQAVDKCWPGPLAGSERPPPLACHSGIEMYADANGYLSGAAHFNWMPSFELQHNCLIVTHCLSPRYLPTSLGRRVCQQFWTVLGAGAWLLGYRLLQVSHGFSQPCTPSFDI